MDIGKVETGWRSRVKVVTDRWRKKVKYASPQDEKAINGTLRLMRSLMEKPMVLDGEVQTDEFGEPIPRRVFWRLAHPEDALELTNEQNLPQLQTLEQLADIIFIARFDPPILNKLLENEEFLKRIAMVRDQKGNNLLHWTAAAELPKKTFFSLSAALRRLMEREETDPKLADQIHDTLKAENDDSVKLHEIAYALKDEGLAAELMRSKISVREKNKAGQTFVHQTLQAEGGEEYLAKLSEIAEEDHGETEEEKISEDVKEELQVTEEDHKISRRLSAAEELMQDFLHGDGKFFRNRLSRAVDGDWEMIEVFLPERPQEAAINRGVFHFGRPDRFGNDWLYHVLARKDIDQNTVDNCATLIERHSRGIADVFAKARKGIDVDDLSRQLSRVYLRRTNSEGRTVLHQAITTRKASLLHRLLAVGLYKPQQIQSARDLAKKREMLDKNMQLIVGNRLNDNLFVAAAVVDPPGSGVEDDIATSTAMKMLEVLFEPLIQQQGYALFQKIYKVGKAPKVRKISFYDYIFSNPQIRDRVKEAFQLYANMYISPEV